MVGVSVRIMVRVSVRVVVRVRGMPEVMPLLRVRHLGPWLG